MTEPLLGLRVLDLSRVLAGPLATMILGDLGADVIKVERSITGDESRGWGPPFDERGESAYFLSCNRNKISVAASLADAADQAMLRALALEADVVVDNFRGSTLERHGLAPMQLLASNPRLIWCTITGFGAASSRPGYDFVVQAESGWMAITGDVAGAPTRVGVALADVMSGKDAAISILAALAGSRNGAPEARRLFVSLQHSAISSLMNVAQSALVTGRESRRWGNAHGNLVPYELFEAADRAIVVAVGSDTQFAALAGALQLHELNDPRFATNAGRIEHREAVVGAIRKRLAERPAAKWIALLDAVGVPCGVVRSVLEALGDVQTSALTGIAPIPPRSVRLPPPTLDQHGAIVRAKGWAAFADPKAMAAG